jgi:hypothetical protein
MTMLSPAKMQTIPHFGKNVVCAHKIRVRTPKIHLQTDPTTRGLRRFKLHSVNECAVEGTRHSANLYNARLVVLGSIPTALIQHV